MFLKYGVKLSGSEHETFLSLQMIIVISKFGHIFCFTHQFNDLQGNGSLRSKHMIYEFHTLIIK